MLPSCCNSHQQEVLQPPVLHSLQPNKAEWGTQKSLSIGEVHHNKLLHWPVGVNKLAYYKMREDTLLRLSLHCFVDL